MIKLYELNQETRALLDGFSGHEVELILDYATDLMLEMERYRGRSRMGENGCVELVCALLVWMKSFNDRKKQTTENTECTEKRKGNHERHKYHDDGEEADIPRG